MYSAAIEVQRPTYIAEPGSGRLVFVREANRTVIDTVWSRSPLRFHCPKNAGLGAWVFAASFGGGLVDGDALHYSVELRRGAMALITTQASTKIYRSRSGSSQRVEIEIGADAFCALVPDPVVCFRDAVYRQDQQIALEQGGSVLLVDVLAAGRVARGERWSFTHYQSRTRVIREGRELLFDAIRLDPAEGAIAQRMGRFDAIATLLAYGPRAEPLFPALLAEEALVRRGALISTSQRLGNEGVLLRIAGESISLVQAALRSRLSGLADLLGDDLFARKW